MCRTNAHSQPLGRRPQSEEVDCEHCFLSSSRDLLVFGKCNRRPFDTRWSRAHPSKNARFPRFLPCAVVNTRYSFQTLPLPQTTFCSILFSSSGYISTSSSKTRLKTYLFGINFLSVFGCEPFVLFQNGRRRFRVGIVEIGCSEIDAGQITD